MSKINWATVCGLAGITAKKTDAGLEIYEDTRKLGTLVTEGNDVLYVYPPGGEHKHTRMCNTKLTPMLIERIMAQRAMAVLQEAARKLG